jgi:UDP:flavonoid glycosyltransferase YjiC (YdhE family)
MYRSVEPWMYTRGTRPRVLLTSGSRLSSEGTPHTMELAALLGLAIKIAELDTELVLAVPEELAARLRGPLEPYGAQVGWMPLNLVAPTSDLIIHHGGTGTNMNAMRCGLPQLVVPELPDAGEMRPLYEFGAAIELPKGEQSEETIVALCREMLDNPVYRQRARTLERELRTLPLPSEVVGVLENLTADT